MVAWLEYIPGGAVRDDGKGSVLLVEGKAGHAVYGVATAALHRNGVAAAVDAFDVEAVANQPAGGGNGYGHITAGSVRKDDRVAAADGVVGGLGGGSEGSTRIGAPSRHSPGDFQNLAGATDAQSDEVARTVAVVGVTGGTRTVVVEGDFFAHRAGGDGEVQAVGVEFYCAGFWCAEDGAGSEFQRGSASSGGASADGYFLVTTVGSVVGIVVVVFLFQELPDDVSPDTIVVVYYR